MGGEVTRLPFPIPALLALSIIVSLAISGCAVVQGLASAGSGYLTHKEFNDHDARIDALETRVKVLDK